MYKVIINQDGFVMECKPADTLKGALRKASMTRNAMRELNEPYILVINRKK